MKYTCNDIFMVRTPSLPVNLFLDFINSQEISIHEFISQQNLDQFFDHSILISSRNLYEAKEKRLQQSEKKNKAKALSMIKFLIRSSTRPTPYGFFAGVALGAFADIADTKGALIVDEKKAIIECSVDHAWLSHLVYELENNPTVFPQLKLRFNNNCYVSGDRLKNPHYSNHGFVMPDTTVVNRNHIRNTPLITFIKQEAQTFITCNALKSKIQNQYPGVPEEKIVASIQMLMENEILLTNLRAPSNCANGLAYVMKILEPIEAIADLKENLLHVSELVNQINNEREVDKINAATMQEIYALQEGLLKQVNEKDLLAVNKGVVLTQNQLPRELKETIENFCEGLAYLQVKVPSRLDTFKKQFQEVYGSNIEVPLCDIIDPNNFNGLSFLENELPIQDEKDKKIKQIVDEKILYCLQSHGKEVVLCKEDFLSLGNVDEEKLPTSFDINFFVTKQEETYHLQLAPAGGSAAAGDMFNRFSHVLDADLFHQYKDNNKRLQNADPDVITVEIREGITKGRLGNINNHSSEHPYYIALATNDDHSQATELSLDDLWIGKQNDRLYIKSKSQGKQCKIVYDCMVNKKILSDVTRLLLFVCADDEIGLIPRIHNLMGNNYIVTPRISYEGVVIQAKSWNLPAHLFDLKTLESFTASLQLLRDKYSIDDIVYLAEFDNRLMLHLNKAYSTEILYKHIQKNKSILFHALEQNALTNTICLDASGKRYVSEISCSLLLANAPKRSLTLDNQIAFALQNENRPLMLLQNGWVYAKLYHMDDRENEVLHYISYFLQSIGDPKFFYLRYIDPVGKHLRVRFQYTDADTAQNHLAEIQDMLIRFREYKLINQVQFDIYLRENNRYGGYQLIELAEDVFFADSIFVIQLLNELDIEQEANLEQAYLLGICTMLTAFYESLEDMLHQTDLMPLLDANKKIFRGNKQVYIKKVEQLLTLGDSDQSNQMMLLINKRQEAIKNYDENISKMPQLTNARERIISSIIHMFCNRLKGDGSLEQRYLNIVRESLSNIVEKNKRIQVK